MRKKRGIFSNRKQKRTENVKEQQRGLNSSCNETTCGSIKEALDIREFIVSMQTQISIIQYVNLCYLDPEVE